MCSVTAPMSPQHWCIGPTLLSPGGWEVRAWGESVAVFVGPSPNALSPNTPSRHTNSQEICCVSNHQLIFPEHPSDTWLLQVLLSALEDILGWWQRAEKSWPPSSWIPFVIWYISICVHIITPGDIIVLVANAHLSGLNSTCKCSPLASSKCSFMTRSGEAMEFSEGSLLTQTTAFSPPEGIPRLPVGERKAQDHISRA